MLSSTLARSPFIKINPDSSKLFGGIFAMVSASCPDQPEREVNRVITRGKTQPRTNPFSTKPRPNDSNPNHAIIEYIKTSTPFPIVRWPN
jgi:hypothetical protein